MAESFAQDPQERGDPNYIFWSRPPREQPRGSEAGKITGEEYGKLFHEGTTAADDYEKNDLQHQIYDLADTARSKFTSQLANIAGQQLGQPDQGNPLDVLPRQSTQPPQEVKQGVAQVQGLKSSLDAGKITKLQYLQYLIPHIQDLRDTHQGYRPYIDQEVSKITGGDPANERINTLLSLVKEGQEKRNQESNKIESLLDGAIRDGDVNAPAIMQGWKNGTVPASKVYEFTAKSFAYKRNLEMIRVQQAERQLRLGEHAESRAERAEAEAANEQHVDKIYTDKAVSILGTVYTVAGLTMTGQQWMDKIDEWARNPGSRPNDVQIQTLIPFVQSLKAKTDAAAQSEIQFAGLTGVNPEKIKQAREYAQTVLDDHLKMLGEPDKFPMAMTHANWNNAILSGDEFATLNDVNVGDTARHLQVWHKLGGEQFAQVVGTLAGDPKFVGNAWTYGLPNLAKMWGQEKIDPNAAKDPFTFGGNTDKASTDLKDTPKIIPGTVKSYLKQSAFIMDKNTPEEDRVNLARAFFAPTKENLNVLNNFNEQSKWQVFSTLTSPKMTQELVKLGNKYPEVFQNYKNTTEALFENLLRVNTIPALLQANRTYGQETDPNLTRPGAEFGFSNVTTGGPLQYTWDSDNHRVGLLPEDVARIRAQEGPGYLDSPVMQNIVKLNRALSHISNIQRAAGVDTDTYLLQLLAHEGIQPGQTQEANQGPTELDPVASLIVAIIHAHPEAMEAGEAAGHAMEEDPIDPELHEEARRIATPRKRKTKEATD